MLSNVLHIFRIRELEGEACGISIHQCDQSVFFVPVHPGLHDFCLACDLLRFGVAKVELVLSHRSFLFWRHVTLNVLEIQRFCSPIVSFHIHRSFKVVFGAEIAFDP